MREAGIQASLQPHPWNPGSGFASRLCLGKVMHSRLSPVGHTFTFPLCCFDLDVDELPKLAKALRGFSYNGWNIFSIRDSDYLPEGEHLDEGAQGSIRAKLLHYLARSGCHEPVTRIRLITAPRFFGYVFNPVSFYYCYGSGGEVRYIVAEVNNTFGETHLYILDAPLADDEVRGADGRRFIRYTARKEFHVSPFNNRQGEYRFYFSPDRGRVDIRVNLIREGKVVFVSRMSGALEPLTGGMLARAAARYPMSTLLTAPRIMWEALKLHFVKGLPVYSKPIADSVMTIQRTRPSWWQRTSMKFITTFLNKMQRGTLVVSFPDGSTMRFGEPNGELRGRILVHNYDFFTKSLLGGDIGFGESYTDGDWSCDDLTSVLRLFVENIEVLNDRSIWLSYIGRAVNRVVHLAHANSKARSRKNIRAHYDLGNEFFALFLDSSMTYSSGIFRSATDSLADSQVAKRRAMIEKAQLTSQHHLLEIGSGWGALAVDAAKTTGCRVTSITLSERQRDYAVQLAEREGVAHLVDFVICDYRELQGKFDRIISVEMLEAVGHEYLSEFFAVCERVLKPDGVLVLQVITVPDQRYDAYRRGCDWIQRYIFPGGLCPSLGAIVDAARRGSSFVVEDLDNIGVHYGRTLAEWRQSFSAKHAEVRAMGFPEEFVRMWDYYFAYCEAGFASRLLGTLQIVLTRTGNDSLPPCPGYATGS